MLVIGIVLILIGWLLGIGILETLGIVLAVVGAVLLLVGGLGTPVAGRRYWF